MITEIIPAFKAYRHIPHSSLVISGTLLWTSREKKTDTFTWQRRILYTSVLGGKAIWKTTLFIWQLSYWAMCIPKKKHLDTSKIETILRVKFHKWLSDIIKSWPFSAVYQLYWHWESVFTNSTVTGNWNRDCIWHTWKVSSLTLKVGL